MKRDDRSKGNIGIHTISFGDIVVKQVGYQSGEESACNYFHKPTESSDICEAGDDKHIGNHARNIEQYLCRFRGLCQHHNSNHFCGNDNCCDGKKQIEKIGPGQSAGVSVKTEFNSRQIIKHNVNKCCGRHNYEDPVLVYRGDVSFFDIKV